jgi:hypothetical protein
VAVLDCDLEHPPPGTDGVVLRAAGVAGADRTPGGLAVGRTGGGTGPRAKLDVAESLLEVAGQDLVGPLLPQARVHLLLRRHVQRPALGEEADVGAVRPLRAAGESVEGLRGQVGDGDALAGNEADGRTGGGSRDLEAEGLGGDESGVDELADLRHRRGVLGEGAGQRRGVGVGRSGRLGVGHGFSSVLPAAPARVLASPTVRAINRCAVTDREFRRMCRGAS